VLKNPIISMGYAESSVSRYLALLLALLRLHIGYLLEMGYRIPVNKKV